MAESSYKKFSQLLLLLLRGMEGMIVISSGGKWQGYCPTIFRNTE